MAFVASGRRFHLTQSLLFEMENKVHVYISAAICEKWTSKCGYLIKKTGIHILVKSYILKHMLYINCHLYRGWANLEIMFVCCLLTQNFQTGSVGTVGFFLLNVPENGTI